MLSRQPTNHGECSRSARARLTTGENNPRSRRKSFACPWVPSAGMARVHTTTTTPLLTPLLARRTGRSSPRATVLEPWGGPRFDSSWIWFFDARSGELIGHEELSFWGEVVWHGRGVNLEGCKSHGDEPDAGHPVRSCEGARAEARQQLNCARIDGCYGRRTDDDAGATEFEVGGCELVLTYSCARRDGGAILLGPRWWHSV